MRIFPQHCSRHFALICSTASPCRGPVSSLFALRPRWESATRAAAFYRVSRLQFFLFFRCTFLCTFFLHLAKAIAFPHGLPPGHQTFFSWPLVSTCYICALPIVNRLAFVFS